MVFISYSRDNDTDLQPILTELDNGGLNYWIDTSAIPVGEKFVRRIAEGLWEATSFILIDSMESRASYWVKKELSLALRYFDKGHYKAIVRLSKTELPIAADVPWSLSVPLTNLNLADLVRILKNKGEPAQRHPTDGMMANKLQVSDSQIHNWLGRQGNLQCLDQWWAHGKRGICIRGPRQSGKTALAYTWMSILVHLVLDTTKFLMLRMEDETFFSGKRDVKSELDEYGEKYGSCPGLLFLEDVSSSNADDSIFSLVDTVLRHPIMNEKRILVITNSHLPPNIFDIHDINAIVPPVENLDYLSRYGISHQLAYEIHKVVTKYPPMLSIFEKKLSTFLPGDTEAIFYQYLERINKEVAETKHTKL